MKVASNVIGQSVAQWRKTRQSKRAQTGFTIVEVMVVLVVSGGMFIAAAVLISGRQNQTAFDQAVRQVQADIQQAINDVAVGYFPDTNFNCTAGGSGPVLSTGASAGQGTNNGCIFLGKAMQFKVHDTNPEQYAVYSLTGLQQLNGLETTNLSEAQPKAVAPSSAQPAAPNITEIKKLQAGLTTHHMTYNNGAAEIPIGSVAFISTLASYDTGGGIKAGTQQVVVYPVGASVLDVTTVQGVDAINGLPLRSPLTSPPDPSGGVTICFASGGTDQSAEIKIGGAKRSLSVNLKIIKGNTTCS
ncbi:MAG TPA: prepilin-type N-terminal cleavage/methylation domain-containing protein [Candidatus Saccharimonadales bacterium]|nr:prepilin-type N-terminal cleavage/methylation domain-containing protein [Candidatus Saccharimonadales bacterium]